ncbi:mitotic checkpoint regulator, MAD2B-interacting-domain-containing protein [Fennellomyces sp. T-0311]|nr:mitotic checkpoint regulator, MAD2B-interacting-domain-containing protein [Fennellomyces sp. T-0311]
MSLVGNYSSSDSESSDVESSAPPALPKKSTGSGLGSLLPPPKNKSSKSVVYVDLPTAQESDDEEDEAEKRAKRQKLASGSTSGRGLAAMLPPPKRSYTFTKTNSGNNRAAATPSDSSDSKPSTEPEAEKESDHEDKDDRGLDTATVDPHTEDDEEEDSTFTGPFFRLGAELKSSTPPPASSYRIPTRQPQQPAEEKPKPQPPQQSDGPTAVDAYAYNPDPNAMYSYGADPNAYYQYYQQQQGEHDDGQSSGQVSNADESQASIFGELDDSAVTRLTGKRKGRESHIQIKTVNQQDILPSDEWRARASQLAAPKFLSTAPQIAASGLQKKKNNLMALAAQAQAMQEQLDEQYAAGRKTRQEARRKYGF